MVPNRKKNYSRYFLIIFISILAVFLSMFQGWEMTSESWGYWYFARVFSETGGFIVIDRSPLYILYLNLFNWLPYPISVNVEYLVTTTFTMIVIVIFSQRYLGKWIALFAAFAWLPYLQTGEPPVQKLALAFSLMAIMLRNKNNERIYLTTSYAFLLLSYLFRQTYLILIFLLFVADIYRIIRRDGGIKALISWRPKLATDWPFVIVIGIIFWFLFSQSTSPWNNVWYSSTEWFPGNAKSMASGGALQHFNWIYIQNIYGTFVGHDFYFTNKEAFSGATNSLGMLLANPVLFAEIIFHNLKNLVPGMGFIWLPKTGFVIFDFLLMHLLFIAIIYGSFRAARDWNTKVLLFSSLVLVGLTLLAMPKSRYMFPLIPIFIMSLSWYGKILVIYIKKLNPNDQKLFKNFSLFMVIIFILSLLLFTITDVSSHQFRYYFFLFCSLFAFVFAFIFYIISKCAKNNLNNRLRLILLSLPILTLLCWSSIDNLIIWAKLPNKIASDITMNKIQLLENRNEVSFKATYSKVQEAICDCKGIMSLESTFLGAFFDVPLNKIYDIWEIPPFGDLNNSPYKKLNPKRVDCILISKALETEVGMGTNVQIRYQNYIKPYVNKLKSIGAVTYTIPNFGQAIVLRGYIRK